MRIVIFILLLFAVNNPCLAQDEPKNYAADRIRYAKEVSYDNDFAISIGINTDLPIGEWKKYSSFGFGPEVGLSHNHIGLRLRVYLGVRRDKVSEEE